MLCTIPRLVEGLFCANWAEVVPGDREVDKGDSVPVFGDLTKVVNVVGGLALERQRQLDHD